MRRTILMAAVLIAGLAGTNAVPAVAQDYPNRPVEFIVPWSPGGGSDALMRIISNKIEPYLGQPMPIINIPGVGGTIGLAEAATREPDGYTITQVHDGLPVATHTGLTELNWDAFEPIALMTSSPQYLVVRADSPWQTFEEFAAYARENPGEIRMGTTLGGVGHLHAAMIEEAAGGPFSYVGYDGTGERVRALVGGNLDAVTSDISAAQQFVGNGDLRFLAVGSNERVPTTPDVPTFKELGHDLELTITRGIVAPKGTPQEALDTMEDALRQLAEEEEYRTLTNNAGAQVDFRGQDAYRQYLADFDATVARLVGKLQQ